MLKLKDIPQLTRDGHYRINVSWDSLERTLSRWSEREGSLAALDLDPDFQRGHVWTEEQQIAYVEFKLRGGVGSNEIRFNCVGWMKTFKGPFVLVDGKQRLHAVLRFLRNEIKAYGHYLTEYSDVPYNQDFIFCVNDLPTRKDVLRWYLELNTGGTPHTEEEIEKVRQLLVKEK